MKELALYLSACADMFPQEAATDCPQKIAKCYPDLSSYDQFYGAAAEWGTTLPGKRFFTVKGH